MTDTFNSITQYTDMYKDVIKDKTSACGLFSLITAYRFINGQDVTAEQHAKNIDQAVNNIVKHKTGEINDFDSLLKYQVGLEKKHVNTLNIEFTQKSQIYQCFDPELYSSSYSIIFQKNKEFFVVNVKYTESSTTFHIRDCYQTTQYNFDDIDDLLEKLHHIYHIYNDKYKSIEDYSEKELCDIFNNVNNSVKILIIHSVLNNTFKLHLDTKNYFKFKQNKLDYNIDQLMKQIGQSSYKNEDQTKPLKLSELNTIFNVRLKKKDELIDENIDDECDEIADAKLEREKELALLMAMSAQYEDFD